MAREPPPRRNDAALLSKIASQEKLRAKLPPLRLVPHPHAAPSVTGRFLLLESIRWLQESGGFYVKILQKIMARWVPSTVKGRRFVRCSYLFHLSFPTFRFAVKFSSYFALFLLSPSFASVCPAIVRQLPCAKQLLLIVQLQGSAISNRKLVGR